MEITVPTLPVILGLAGCIALLVGLWGGGIIIKIANIPRIPLVARILSSLIGLLLIGIAVWLYTQELQLSSRTIKAPTETANNISSMPLAPPPTETTNGVAPVSSALPLPAALPTPGIYGFATCLDAQGCDGSNILHTFPPNTTKLYVAWKYENIPVGAHLVRTWAVVEKNQNWITYDCIWPGPPNGSKIVSMYDAKGLTAGTWQLTITVNDVVLLQEHITIQGNSGYWDPAGTRNTCF